MLAKEMQKLRQEITDLMKTNQFVRHFGTQYQAEMTTSKKIIFEDQQQVIDLLKKYKLLDKTRVPTQSTIAALLTDPQVPAQAKKELSKYARTVEKPELSVTPNEEL